MSTFHATKLAVRNWRMSSLDAFIDSLTQEKVKLIQMVTLKSSKYHVLEVLENKNSKSKLKLKAKDKKAKSDSEDEGSNSTNEGLNFKKKGNKKRRYQCTYSRKSYHNENSCFKKKMDIMTQFLERNNIDVLDFARREKSVDPWGHCNTMKFKGNDAHTLVARIKYVYDVSDFDTHSDV